MKKSLLITLFFIPLFLFAQKNKCVILNNVVIAPKGVVILISKPDPIIIPDTIVNYDCDTEYDCNTEYRCESAFFGKINFNPYLNSYFRKEEEIS